MRLRVCLSDDSHLGLSSLNSPAAATSTPAAAAAAAALLLLLSPWRFGWELGCGAFFMTLSSLCDGNFAVVDCCVRRSEYDHHLYMLVGQFTGQLQ